MVQRSNRNIPLTAAQRQQLAQLAQCKMTPGSWDKSFIRSLRALPDGAKISLGQAEWINRLMHRYKGQLDSAPLETGVSTGTQPEVTLKIAVAHA